MIEFVCRPGAGHETRIHLGAGACAGFVESMQELAPGKVVVLLDAHLRDPTRPMLASTVASLIAPHWHVIPLPSGEACKEFGVLGRVLRELARLDLDRTTWIVGIGGGSVGDLSGLAASLFLRGIPHVQVPTTLLAMLDSSVGGKTAVDLPEGKNLVGTFWPARAIVADIDFLPSLPPEELRSGIGEALKMAIGFDAELFDLLEREREAVLAAEPSIMTQVIAHCIARKIEVVEVDPQETTGRRRCLNLGHTLGHALEATRNFRMLHGHAVARGLHFALDVARRRGALEPADFQRGTRLLTDYGFLPDELTEIPELRAFCARDKKMEQGRLHFVIPTSIGSCRTEPIPVEELFS